MLIGETVAVEAEGAADLFEDWFGGLIRALVGDAESGEAEAGGGDRGHAAGVERAAIGVPFGAVENLAGVGAGLLSEEETAAALDVVEQGLVGGGEGARS